MSAGAPSSPSRRESTLPHDYFGRTVADWACPECGARFIGPGVCRGVGDGPGKRAHDHEVPTLRVVGCTPPPDRLFLVALAVGVKAPTQAKADELACGVLADSLPKRVVERDGWRFSAQPVETVAEAAFKRRMEFAHKYGHHPTDWEPR